MLPEIFNYFPNLNSINLSTNETDNPEEIVDFISAVNQYHTNSFELFIQWSYDEMDKYKNIIVGNIIRNIKSVIKRLHNIDFNNMTVKMRAQRFISNNLLHNLYKYDTVDTYYNNLYYFDKSIICNNDNIDAKFYPSINFELPINSTEDDGKLLYQLMQQEKELPYMKEFLDIMKQANIKSIDEFIDTFLSNQVFAVSTINELNDFLYCGINYNELVIMFDGTIVSCKNMIYNSNEQNLDVIEKSWQNHLSANIYKSENKDINNLFKVFTYAHSNWSFIIEHMMINMHYLGKAGLISQTCITDEKTIFKYAFLGLTLPWCYYSNLKTTGSIYLQGESFFKFFYNGYIELLEKQYNRMLQNE